MDETLATVALDISNRGYLVYDVDCQNPQVVTLISIFSRNFFKLLQMKLLVIFISVWNTEMRPHHVAEAIFKGLQRRWT